MISKAFTLALTTLFLSIVISVNTAETCRLCFQPNNPTFDRNWKSSLPDQVTVSSDGVLSIEHSTMENIILSNDQLSLPVNSGDIISLEVQFINGAVCGESSPFIQLSNEKSSGEMTTYQINGPDQEPQCDNYIGDDWYEMSLTVPSGDAGVLNLLNIAVSNYVSPGTIMIRNVVVADYRVSFLQEGPVCSNFTPKQLYEEPQIESFEYVQLITNNMASNPECRCNIEAYPKENFGGKVTKFPLGGCVIRKYLPIEALSIKTLCTIKT